MACRKTEPRNLDSPWEPVPDWTFCPLSACWPFHAARIGTPDHRRHRGWAWLAATLQDIDRSAAAIEHMGNSVTQTSQNTGETMQAVDADVRRFGAETLPELERLLAELNVLSTSLRRLSEQTERAPSGLVFGHTTARAGPGESPAAGTKP